MPVAMAKMFGSKMMSSETHTLPHMHVRKILPDPARRLDEVDAVIIVLLHACGDGENVRIEDDVLGRKADLGCQNVVGALTNLGLALERVGLALLVERH